MQRWRVRRRPRIGCSGPHARRFRRDPTTAGARRVDEAITRSQAAGGGMNRRKHPETEPGCWRQRRACGPLADVVKPCCAARAARPHPRMKRTAWAWFWRRCSAIRPSCLPARFGKRARRRWP